MVDIMDMEDIFSELLKITIKKPYFRELKVKQLIAEVKDFVDDQKNIECNNCRGKKFKVMKEPWQVQ